MLEKDIQRACLDYLAARGILAWRANQIPVPLPGGGFRRFSGLRGVSDILGILPQTVDTVGHGQATFGNLLAVEIKRPGGKLSPDQEWFLSEINRRGGIGICVRSVDELEKSLEPFV